MNEMPVPVTEKKYTKEHRRTKNQKPTRKQIEQQKENWKKAKE